MSVPKHVVEKNLVRVSMCVLILSLLSCTNIDKPRIAAESTKFADSLNPPADKNESTDKPSNLQRVFIDSSLSMSGFVGQNASSRTTFDELIDSMPDVLPGCSVYRYGQAGNADQGTADPAQVISAAEFDGRLHDSSTYHLGFNPDDVLIRYLISQKRPELSVILTDGVESDRNGQINTVVVDSLKTWIKAGNLFGILVFKSRFSGQFYSERQRKMIGNIAAENRPFYAFVMATSRREFDDFVEKLKRRFGGLEVILFSDDAIKSTVELPVDSNSNYANEAPPNKPYYWQMVTASNLRPEETPKAQNGDATPAKVNSPTPETAIALGYRYRFEISKSYPVKTLGFRLTVGEHGWDQTQKTFQREASTAAKNVTITDVKQAREGDATIEIFTVTTGAIFRLEADGDYQFYAVEASVYVKDVADDVASLSTRDDSTAENANKTFRFQELVLAILDVHLKERILPRSLPRLYLTASRL